MIRIVVFASFVMLAPLTFGESSVVVDGTSHMSAITTAWVEASQETNFRLAVVNGESGSGGGFKRFCAGATDINKSARPMKDLERSECEKSGVQYLEVLAAHGRDDGKSLRLFVRLEALKREGVRDFLKYCLSDHAQGIAGQHGRPLSPEELKLSRDAVASAIAHATR